MKVTEKVAQTAKNVAASANRDVAAPVGRSVVGF